MPPVERLEPGDDAITLLPGQRVVLEPLGRDGPVSAYGTLIDHIAGERLYVLSPIARLETISLPMGARVRLGARSQGSYYTCATEVVEHVFHPQYLLGLSLPEAMDRRDQREYYRLPMVVQPETVALVDGEGRAAESLPATMVNLGGGGAELVAPTAIGTGALLALQFRLAGELVSTVAQAVAVDEPGPGRFNYRAHCQFLHLDRQRRESIVRFVFRQQMLQLRRGLREEGSR